ncbi:MAG: Gfo/Idh/MocA family protein [Pseudonocardiaceae bacterium]
MSTDRLRAGLIGLGRMGRHHARILRHLHGVDLVGVVDPVGDRYHAADDITLFPDLDALVHYGIDYAVLACPTPLHEPLGTVLATACIPTLIEKPLAADTDAANRLAQAFHTAGVPAAVGYIERFNPALISLRTRMQDGQLGDIIEINTRRTGPFPAHSIDVGVVHDLATHDIDLTTWVTGQHYTTIAARTAHRNTGPQEDLLAAFGQLTNGTITHHHVNRISPLTERATIIIGENGCFIADTLTTTLTYQANRANSLDVIHYAINKTEPLRAEREAFRDTVLGHRPPVAPLQDALHAVLVADAALRAARTRTTIAIAPASTDRANLTGYLRPGTGVSPRPQR